MKRAYLGKSKTGCSTRNLFMPIHRSLIRIITIIFLVLLGCVGCAHDEFVRGSGDASQYVLQQIIVRGGRPVSTNSLPKLGSQWRYFQDQNGAVIHLPRDQFPAVESFLNQTLGTPSMPVNDLTNGGKMGMYGVKDFGAGIQFGYYENETFINILRPISVKELVEHLPKAMEQAQKHQ